jgi:FAD/FMN-containing dehydrogenase
LKQRDPNARWPLYQFDPDVTYVNVGFWSTVPLPAGVDSAQGLVNRAIETAVTALDGRKSLYSTAFYDREGFYEIYGQDEYQRLKSDYDPTHRLTGLFEKCVSGH